MHNSLKTFNMCQLKVMENVSLAFTLLNFLSKKEAKVCSNDAVG